MKLQCDNCSHTADYDDFPEAEDFHTRNSIGFLFSDKECPECGALAFPVAEGAEAERERVRDAAPALLAALRRIITIDACITVEGGKQAREAIAKAEEIVSPERPQKTSEFVECLAMMNHHVGSYLDGGESTQEDIERWMDVASDLIGAVQSKKGGES